MKQKNIINQRRNYFNQNEKDEKKFRASEESENNIIFNNYEDNNLIELYWKYIVLNNRFVEYKNL